MVNEAKEFSLIGCRLERKMENLRDNKSHREDLMVAQSFKLRAAAIFHSYIAQRYPNQCYSYRKLFTGSLAATFMEW